MFSDSCETEMDIDEGKTRPKKPSLVQKIIKLQEAINDATRRKIHFTLYQGKLLEDCFCRSKETYKRTLEQVNVKK